MTATSVMLKFSRNEFACLLASLSIEVVPGMLDGLNRDYLGLEAVDLDEGLASLIDRGLVTRTPTGIAIAEDLLTALVRFQRPSLVIWATTTSVGPVQHIVDVIGDSTGFTGVIVQPDESVDLLLVPSREAVAGLLTAAAGVTTGKPESPSPLPTNEISFGRAVEIVHHALGKPEEIPPPANEDEAMLAQTTSFTTFSFWDLGSEGVGSEGGGVGTDSSASAESTQPKEFAVAIAGGQSWLLGVTDVDGDLVMIPVDANDVESHILGRPF